MVTENKKFSRRHANRPERLAVAELGGDVGLEQSPAIDEDLAVDHLDRLARQADDPLDIRFGGVQRVPENHHVAAMDVLNPVDELVDEDSFLVGELGPRLVRGCTAPEMVPLRLGP